MTSSVDIQRHCFIIISKRSTSPNWTNRDQVGGCIALSFEEAIMYAADFPDLSEVFAKLS